MSAPADRSRASEETAQSAAMREFWKCNCTLMGRKTELTPARLDRGEATA
jgi:hypothetical protein